MAMTRPKNGPRNNNKRGNKGGQRRYNRQYQQATTNVQLQNQPQIDTLNSMLQQNQQDALRRDQGAQSIFGGYQKELQDLPNMDFNKIANDFTSRIGTLNGMLGGGGVGTTYSGGIGPGEYQIPVGMPESEAQAARGLGMAIGEGGNAALSSYAARERGAREAAGREGALAERYARGDINQQMQDTLQNYQNQLAGINRMVPSQIDQEQQQIAEQALTRRLAQSQMKGDAAFSKYLQGMLSSQIGGGGAGGGGNVRPGGSQNPYGGPGAVAGDTAAGGNQFSPGGDTAVGGNAGNPNPYAGTEGRVNYTGPIPQAWQGAQTYEDLPGLVQHAYQRDPGESLRSIFAGEAHPSFNNFDQFQNAYQQFLDQINKLYRIQYPPVPGQGLR